MHYDMKRVGEIIQKSRASKGLTQTVLADKVEASLRTIIAIENGQRNPTFDTLFKIIHALSIPADLIFRPDAAPTSSEQEQFIREFLDAGEKEQRLSIAASRAIWREMKPSK